LNPLPGSVTTNQKATAWQKTNAVAATTNNMETFPPVETRTHKTKNGGCYTFHTQTETVMNNNLLKHSLQTYTKKSIKIIYLMNVSIILTNVSKSVTNVNK